jgi:hypothetical protein
MRISVCNLSDSLEKAAHRPQRPSRSNAFRMREPFAVFGAAGIAAGRAYRPALVRRKQPNTRWSHCHLSSTDRE